MIAERQDAPRSTVTAALRRLFQITLVPPLTDRIARAGLIAAQRKVLYDE